MAAISFNIDAIFGPGEVDDRPPTLTIAALPTDLVTTTNVTVSGKAVTDDQSGVARLQARVDSGPLQDVTFDPATGGFSYTTALPLDGTADGAHLVQFVATDAAGNASGPVTGGFRLDTRSPTIVVLNHTSGQTFRRNTTLAGRVADAVSGVKSLGVQVDSGAFTPLAFAADGSFQLATTFTADGTHVIHFRAADLAGNPEALIAFSFVLDTTVPPDPGEIAPALDQAGFTSMLDATSFLYTGPDAIQTGVTPGTIELLRAAVIRGKVVDRSNHPLSGVAISVLDHPEFGSTRTRDDGMFDLAVNGGGYLTVEYARAGYLADPAAGECPVAGLRAGRGRRLEPARLAR